MDRVRVLRVLEYVGPRDWVENTLRRGAVPINGERMTGGGTTIRSAIVGPFPEFLSVIPEPAKEI